MFQHYSFLSKTFFIILGSYLETELWEQVKQNYTGFPRPLNGPLKVHMDVDSLQVIDVVVTLKLLTLNSLLVFHNQKH